jgi:hypothetical protein
MIKWYLIVGLVLSNVYTIQYIQKQTNQHKAELLTLETNQQKKLLELQEQRHEDIIKALNQATAENQHSETEYAALHAANKQLQQSIKQMDGRIRKLPESARAAYTTALGDVLGECTTRYTDLARKADGHVSDIRMYQRIGKPKRKPLK